MNNNDGERFQNSTKYSRQSLGGGGHKSASGFKTTGTIKEVLEKVKRELKKELK